MNFLEYFSAFRRVEQVGILSCWIERKIELIRVEEKSGNFFFNGLKL